MSKAGRIANAARAVGPWTIARVVIAVLLLGGLVGWTWKQGESISFDRELLLGILVAQPFAVLALGALSWRLKLLAGEQVGIRAAGEAICVAMIAFVILPSRLSEAAKPLYLHKFSGLPLSRALAVLVFERLLDLICLCALIFLAIAAGGTTALDHLGGVSEVIAALAIVGLVLFGVVLRYPDSLVKIVRWLPVKWLRTALSSLIGAARETASIHRLGSALAVAAALWLMSYLIYLAFFHVAQPDTLTPSEVLFVFVVGTLGISIAIAPGGLGTFEAAIALALTAHGIELGQGVVIALALRVATFLPAVAAFAAMQVFGGSSGSELLSRAGLLSPRARDRSSSGLR